MDKLDWNRLALVTALAEKMQGKGGDFGRTALMKFAYLLQAVKEVPLGYNFTLYSYGPFDSSVLSDLSFATSLNAVGERTVHYPSSYGYDIKPGKEADTIKQKAKEFLEASSADIDWVIQEFGSSGAGELELVSTIVYADREMEQNDKKCHVREIAELVNKIKPHFTILQIENKTAQLLQRGLLKSTTS